MRHTVLTTAGLLLLAIASAQPAAAYECDIGNTDDGLCIDEDEPFGTDNECSDDDFYNGWEWVYLRPLDDAWVSVVWNEACGDYDERDWSAELLRVDGAVLGQDLRVRYHHYEDHSSEVCTIDAEAGPVDEQLDCTGYALPRTGLPGRLGWDDLL